MKKISMFLILMAAIFVASAQAQTTELPSFEVTGLEISGFNYFGRNFQTRESAVDVTVTVKADVPADSTMTITLIQVFTQSLINYPMTLNASGDWVTIIRFPQLSPYNMWAVNGISAGGTSQPLRFVSGQQMISKGFLTHFWVGEPVPSGPFTRRKRARFF